MEKKKDLKIGETYYRISDQRKFEVIKIDVSGAYLCHFKGTCSQIFHVFNGMSTEQFNSIYSTSHRKAFESHVLTQEAYAKGLRQFFNSSIYNDQGE